MNNLTQLSMKTLVQFFCVLLLAAWVNVALAQGARNGTIGADDDEEEEEATPRGPARPLNPNAAKAHIVVNGEVWNLANGQELVLSRDRTYDVAIHDLKPNSRVFIDFRKGGVSVGSRGFDANRYGEFMFEYTTPSGRARGDAVVKYTAANGREVTLTLKVRLE
jgi:hypothetical protein